LSILIVSIEIMDHRLDPKSVLGSNFRNPKRLLAMSWFIGPALVVISALPVVLYFFVVMCWHSVGFCWSVVMEAFSPDWRTSQDVFVATARETVTIVQPEATELAKPFWQVW